MTRPSTFGVSLKLTATCSVDASKATIAFEDQSATTLGDNRIAASEGNIEVLCSKDAPYVINLSSENFSSSNGEGEMIHKDVPANKVKYQLYSDLNGTANWGNDGLLGAGNIGTGVSGIGGGLSAIAKPHKVYARIIGTTDVLLGEYSDTVTASIVY